jgi:hypothetical protein
MNTIVQRTLLCVLLVGLLVGRAPTARRLRSVLKSQA